MKFKRVKWFTARTSVGIVQVESEFDGIKYYISAVDGLDTQVDIKSIMDWGAAYPKDAGDVLFNS